MRQNLGELVLESAAKYGDRVAFQVRRGFRVERVTFRQVGERAQKVAGWLGERGLTPGDRVVVWAANMPEYAVLFFGAWLAGVVVVPIDARTSPETLHRFVKASSPRLGFKSRGLDAELGDPPVETFELETLFDVIADVMPLEVPPAIGSDQLCEIAYTSGTTGVPKGVMLTHDNYLAEIEALLEAFPLDPADRALSLLPLSHVFEQAANLLLAYTCGVRMTYLPRVNPATIRRALQEERITCLGIVPELLRLLLDGIERRVREAGEWQRWLAAHRLAARLPFPLRRQLFRRLHAELGGALQFFACGGAPLPVKVAESWERMGVRVFEGYGLTETAAGSTLNTRRAKRMGAVGKPLPGVEVRIAGDGEVLIRGRTVTPGYFNDPERTARAFVDGWFRTDDVGTIDADGFLRITGRAAFKIVLADGRNVYPEDIEQLLSRHPLVRDSCVVGVERQRGEVVHAVLLTDAADRASDIIRETNRQLGPHQQISEFSVWPEADFPRTPTLKVDRGRVRRAVEGRPQPATVEAPAVGTSDPLVALIATAAARPASAVEDTAELEADLGLDSVGRVGVLAGIEEELGRVVDETAVGPQTTVADLRRLIAAGGAAAPSEPMARWPRSWWARQVGRLLLRIAFRLQDRWFRIEVVHPERAATLPWPSILIFNYQGPYVPLLMLRALPARLRSRVAVAVDARLWQGDDRWQGALAALAAQGFPFVKSGGAVRSSIEELGRWLDDGYMVIVSPEGDPELNGELLPFLDGTGLMAVELGVPVVPFKVDGYHRLFPQALSFPFLPNRRGPVRLIIGEPIVVPRNISPAEATRQIRQAFVETS